MLKEGRRWRSGSLAVGSHRRAAPRCNSAAGSAELLAAKIMRNLISNAAESKQQDATCLNQKGRDDCQDQQASNEGA